MSERRDALYLSDMLIALERIEQYVAGMSFEAFRKDIKTIDAVIRNLAVIGETAARVSSGTKEANPGIPWREMIGMRNKVVHEYFGVDEEILWKTITEDLAALHPRVLRVSRSR